MRYFTGLVATIVFMTGCLFQGQNRFSIETQEDMERALLKIVPVGTSLVDAKKRMDDQGFECRMIYQGFFQELNLSEKMDYLRCEKDDRLHKWLDPVRVWRIGLVIKDNVVEKTVIWVSG